MYVQYRDTGRLHVFGYKISIVEWAKTDSFRFCKRGKAEINFSRRKHMHILIVIMLRTSITNR